MRKARLLRIEPRTLSYCFCMAYLITSVFSSSGNSAYAAKAISMPESQIWMYTTKEKRKTVPSKITQPNSPNFKSIPKSLQKTKEKRLQENGTNADGTQPTIANKTKIILEKLEEPLKANQLDLALRILEYETKQSPDDQDLIVAKARVLDALNRTKAAIGILQVFSQSHPNKWSAKSCLGDLYFLSGDYRASRSVLESVEKAGAADALSFYRLAQLATVDSDLDKAINFSNRALQEDPHMFEAQLMLARLFAEKRNFADANKAYKRAIELDPDSSQAIMEWASLVASNGKTLEGIEKLLQAHRIDPTSVEIVQRFITIYGMRQDWPNALDYAKSWAKFEPNNPEAYFICAWCSLQLGEYSDASAFLKQALKIDAENAPAHYLNAFAQYEQRKIEDAIYEFKQAEEFATKKGLKLQSLLAGMNLVIVYASKARFEEANQKLSELERAQSDESPTDKVHLQAIKSYVLALQGKREQAKELAAGLLKSDSDAPIYAVLAMALCEISEGNNKSAIERLKGLSRLEPLSSYILYQLASAYLAEGNVSEAVEQVQQALQIAPSNLMAKEVLAKALIQKKNFSGAIPLLKECIARNPKDLQLRLTLAEAQIENGESEMAELTYEKAQKAFPESAEPVIGLAGIMLRTKQFKQAEVYAEQSVSIQPTNDLAHLYLAKALLGQGKVSQALNELDYFGALDIPSLSTKYAVLLLRANALLWKGNYREALASFQKADIVLPGNSMEIDDRIAFALAAERSRDYSLASQIIHSLRSQIRGGHVKTSKSQAEALERQWGRVKAKLDDLERQLGSEKKFEVIDR